MQSPFLIGPTIYLRPLEKADAPTLAPWFNDSSTSSGRISWRVQADPDHRFRRLYDTLWPGRLDLPRVAAARPRSFQP